MKNPGIQTLVAITLIFSAETVVYSCPAKNVQASALIEQQVGDVVSHLVGVMDTSAQAQANPKAPNVRITSCKITVQTPVGRSADRAAIFLYQEQAMSQNLAKPYRQRFLKISPSADNQSIESQSFKPPTPESWTGLCSQLEAKRVVQLSDIGEPKCSVFLKREGDHYVGETPTEGCPSDYKGAVKVTNLIVLHSAGMDTLDRAFDAAGNQVWGAKDEPYQFRWIQPSASQ